MGVPDDAGDELGTAGRHDDAAARGLDDAHRLAVGVGGDEQRPAGGEDAVGAARDDEAREPASEAEKVEAAGGERVDSTSRGW